MVFRHRSFAFFAVCRLAVELASGAQAVAIAWFLYDLTNSAVALGLLGLVRFAPGFALVLVTGVVADRFDRRLILAACWTVELLCTLVLAAFVWSGGVSETWIFIVVAVFSAARAFEHPTASAVVSNVLPQAEIPHAVAWSAAMRQYGNIVGPVVGGVFYAFGPDVVFGLSGALFALSVALLSGVRTVVAQRTIQRVDWATLFAGFSFVRARHIVLGVISLDLFAVLLGGATALLPIFARDILHAGPWALGALRGAPPTGAFLMATFLAFRPISTRAGRKMFAAVACFGFATMVFGLSTNIWLSLAALIAMGAADGVSVVVRQTVVQLATPDDMRGRVGAINAVFISTSNSLGDFEAGLMAAWLGAVPAVVVGGVGTVLVAALWTRLFPELWNVDSLTGDLENPPLGKVPASA